MNLFTRLALAAVFVCGLSVNSDASRVDIPYQHCLDDSGDPLSGCRAYTFEAGTTTVHQLYSDKARTSAHGDFVTADSAGRFPDAYGDPSQCIKIVFRKSDGTTEVDTLDNICPPADASDTSEAQTALGITGTAATANVGTSGDALGKLNTANTWSATQTFTATTPVELNSTSAGATAGPDVLLSRDSVSPAADDILGEITFDGKDDGTGDVEYGSLRCAIADPTDTQEDGYCEVTANVGGTKTAGLQVGIFDSSDTSVKGANLASGWTYYVNGFPAPGTPIAVIEDQQTSGTDAGGCTSGSDETRILNTEVFDPFSLVSLSSNQITLQPGTYLIQWSVPGFRVNNHQSLLYDITGAAEVKRGTSEDSDKVTDSESEGVNVQTRSVGFARVTIASANVYEIRHRCETTTATDGLGQGGGFGTEVYTQVTIWAG